MQFGGFHNNYGSGISNAQPYPYQSGAAPMAYAPFGGSSLPFPGNAMPFGGSAQPMQYSGHMSYAGNAMNFQNNPMPYSGSALPYFGGAQYSAGALPFSGSALPFGGSTAPMQPPFVSSGVQPVSSQPVSRQKFADGSLVDAKCTEDSLFYPAKVVRFDKEKELYTIAWTDGDTRDTLKTEQELRVTAGFNKYEGTSGAYVPGFRPPTTSDMMAIKPPPGYKLAGFATSVKPAEGTRSGRFIFENGGWRATSNNPEAAVQPQPARQYTTQGVPMTSIPYFPQVVPQIPQAVPQMQYYPQYGFGY